MTLYKKADLSPLKGPTAEPSVPLAPTGVMPHGALPASPNEEPAIVAPEPVTATTAQPADLWSNGRWAVTADGLESRAVVNSVPIAYVIGKEHLLRVQHGTANVSMWAAQLATKSWVDDPEALIEALTEALRRHHPGQTVVDLAATREHAMREWRRLHHRDHPDDGLGREYVPGNATLQRAQKLWAEPAADRVVDDPWISDILHRVRRALVRHGVDPAVHSGGLHVNERLVLMATGGATDEEIAAAADRLKNEHVLHGEEPEEEVPPEADDYIE